MSEDDIYWLEKALAEMAEDHSERWKLNARLLLYQFKMEKDEDDETTE